MEILRHRNVTFYHAYALFLLLREMIKFANIKLLSVVVEKVFINNILLLANCNQINWFFPRQTNNKQGKRASSTNEGVITHTTPA